MYMYICCSCNILDPNSRSNLPKPSGNPTKTIHRPRHRTSHTEEHIQATTKKRPVIAQKERSVKRQEGKCPYQGSRQAQRHANKRESIGRDRRGQVVAISASTTIITRTCNETIISHPRAPTFTPVSNFRKALTNSNRSLLSLLPFFLSFCAPFLSRPLQLPL